MASISLEEAGLAHILNAEGEKLQTIIGVAATVDELSAANDSVGSVVNGVADIENGLQLKINALLKTMPPLAFPKVTPTGILLSGGLFEIRRIDPTGLNGLGPPTDTVVKNVSAVNGVVNFGALLPNNFDTNGLPVDYYEIYEISPIPGFVNTAALPLQIAVKSDGTYTDMSGVPMSIDPIINQYSLQTMQKLGDNQVEFDGITYEMYNGDAPNYSTDLPQVTYSATGPNGYFDIDFNALPPGVYTLHERDDGAYAGYEPTADIVVYVGSDGSILFEATPVLDPNGQIISYTGIPRDKYTTLVNNPVSYVTFRVTDEFGAPIAGATFNLTGVGVNQTVTSDANGYVKFPGYTPQGPATGPYPAGYRLDLTETSVPDGYIRDTAVHQIVVGDGTTTVTTIDGSPISNYSFRNAAQLAAVSGRTLNNNQTYDGDWTEIAQYGDYSLILRNKALRQGINSSFKFSTGKKAKSEYSKSEVRNVINNWYNHTNNFTDTGLADKSPIRKHGVANTALENIGTDDSEINGISIPKGSPTNYGQDVAFALSAAEAKHFIGGTITNSRNAISDTTETAQLNWNRVSRKLKSTDNIWLRSTNAATGCGSVVNAASGIVSGDLKSANRVYPAVWVKNDIFKKKK